MYFRKVCFLFPLLAFFVFGQESPKNDTIPKFTTATMEDFRMQLGDIFNDPAFSSAQWGAVVQSLTTGEYFFKYNEDKLFMPASNLKLFTSAAGLVLLGKDYRFKTEIYVRGTLDGTTLKGDLIIRGFGDPTISGRFYNQDMLKIFSNWADSLVEAGIEEIDGNIIGDDNAFDDIGLGEGWAWDYETEWYAAPSGALSFNDNCIDITITPTEIAEKAVISVLPENQYFTLTNNVITVPADSFSSISVYRERGTNIVTVSGTIKVTSAPLKRYSTVSNPTQYFVVTLRDVLIKKGIKVKGFGVDCDDLLELPDYEYCTRLFTHYSVPLSIITTVINKNSQNFFAEQLLRVLGYEFEKYGSSTLGIKVLKNFLGSIGINTDNINICDGSGLSRLNLVTPKQISTLLSYMYKHELFPVFYNTLPIAGKDGTLANRLRGTRAENNLRAKTGFIGGVRSLSGYIYTGDAEPVVLSLIVNNFTVPLVLAENLHDLICIRLANYKRK